MSDHDDVARVQVWLWAFAVLAALTAARGCSTTQRLHQLERRVERLTTHPSPLTPHHSP